MAADPGAGSGLLIVLFFNQNKHDRVPINSYLLLYYIRVTIEIRDVFDSNVYFQLIMQNDYNAFILQIGQTN